MPRAITPKQPLLLSLTVALYILAFPKWNLASLAWVALVPLLIVLLKDETLNTRRAFLFGWGAGTFSSIGLLYWLIPTYRAAQHPYVLALGCLLLLSGYLGLYWGVWSVLVWRTKPSSSFIRILFAASLWTALEYLRTWLFSGFPWTLLADSQISQLPLLQIASFTGSYGVSFLIVAVNAAVAHALVSTPTIGKHRALAPLALALGLTGGIYEWGRREMTLPVQREKPVSVALLQGNVDQYKKWDNAYVDEIEDRYASLVEEASQRPVDLIVWPETSVPGYLLQDEPLRRWLVQVVRKSRKRHLIGAPKEMNKDIYNASYLLSPEGELEASYEKRHLVPFGEIIPLAPLLKRYIRALNELGGFTAGTASSVVSIGGVPMGVNICYEAIFPALVRKSVRDGAQILINQTNDAWYLQTSAPYQHWAPNVFRAIENRRYVLRANNTGISGIIDPFGRTVVQSKIFEPRVLVGTVYPSAARTFYTAHGDLFAAACAALALGGLVWAVGLVILRRSSIKGIGER